MWTLFGIGLISVAAIMFLLLKMNIRKWLWIDVILDIGVTVLFISMFAGTFSGMVAAVMAGTIFSVILFVLKKVLGYQRFTLRGWKSVKPSWSLSYG